MIIAYAYGNEISRERSKEEKGWDVVYVLLAHPLHRAENEEKECVGSVCLLVSEGEERHHRVHPSSRSNGHFEAPTHLTKCNALRIEIEQRTVQRDFKCNFWKKFLLWKLPGVFVCLHWKSCQTVSRSATNVSNSIDFISIAKRTPKPLQ